MNSSILEKLIIDDKIEKAVLCIKDILDGSKNVEKVALNVLGVLATFVSKHTRCKTTCKSDPKHIFELANECCLYLSRTWKCSHVIFMQYVYHICNYLIKIDYALFAKKLAFYFINLKNENKVNNIKLCPWNKDQKCVLVNLLSTFANFIIFNQNKSRNLFVGEDSVQSWWTFIMTLSELNNYENISLTFQVTTHFFFKMTNPLDVVQLGNFVFKHYRILMDNSYFDSSGPVKTQKDLSQLVLMIDAYFRTLYDDELFKLDCSDLLYVLEKNVFLARNEILSLQIELIMNLISLLCKDKCDQFSPLLHKISSDIIKLGSSINKEWFSFIIGFVFKLFKSLSKKKYLLPEQNQYMFKLAFNLQLIFKQNSSSINFNVKQFNSLVNKIACATFYIVISVGDNPERLKSVFNEIWSTINLYFQCKSFAETSMNDLIFGVDCCKKAILTFKNADCNYEAKEFSRLMIILLRAINFTSLPPTVLKDNVAQLVNIFVETSPKCNYSFECLSYLLALMDDPNPIFECEDKFKYWCKLKLLSGAAVESVTVYDIINRDNENLLDETVTNDLLKWPFSSVTSLDHENFLLDEIKSYLKYRDLMKAPVLAVYRATVQNVQSKIIIARVLCYTTEASTLNPDLFSHLKKFQVSLRNMIKIVCLNKDNKINEINSIENKFLLGDLYYYLARCDVCSLRQVAQKLVVDLQPSTSDDHSSIPVVEDPLDTTITSCEFSYISYNTHRNLMSLLKQAYDYWKQAADEVKGNKDNSDSSITAVNCSMYNIKSTGYLYKLLKNIRYETKLWQLLFEVASSFNSPKFKIIAFSELLSTSLLLDQKSIDEMNSYVKSQSDIQEKYFYYLFQISLCKNKLYNKQFDECREIFNLIDESSVKVHRLVYIQYNILSYWLKSSLKIFDEANSRALINQLEQSLAMQRSNVCCNFIELTVLYGLLLDLSLTVGRMFCQSKDVRYARFYSSHSFKIAQELHLPIRVCEFLILQAQTDELCVDSYNVAEKLKGIESILELSRKDPGYDCHPGVCVCSQCSHIEFMLAIIYAILVKARYYILQQTSENAIVMFKESQELIARLKKKINGKFVTEIIECDILFSKMSVDVLTKWGKCEKAMKYLDYGMRCIQKNYKPCDSELSSLSLVNFLKFKFNIELTPSNVTKLYSEPSVDEFCKTPEMSDELKLKSPPPIGWKVFSPLPTIAKQPDDLPQKKTKLIFINTPLVNKSNSSNSDQENSCNENKPKLQNKVLMSKENTGKIVTPSKLSSNIPTIVIDCCEDNISANQDKTGTSYLQLSNKRNCRSIKQLINNPISPKKSSVSVFCDEIAIKPMKNMPVSPKIAQLSHKQKIKSSKPRRKSHCSKSLFGSEENSDEKSLCTNKTNDISVQGPVVVTATSSLDDSDISIIDATIIEGSEGENKRFQLTSSQHTPQIETLQSQFSNLSVTPESLPNFQPFSSSVRKYTRKNKQCNINFGSSKIHSQNIKQSDSTSASSIPALPQSELTPNVRSTRSSKRLLLSSTKKYRI